MDKDILFEGLSALVGVSVKPQTAAPPHLLSSIFPNQASPDILSIQDLLSAVYFKQDFWQDVNFRRTGLRAMPPSYNDLFIMEDQFFDPQWNYDFTNIYDTTTFMRGNEVYKRPCGWMRYALKVLGKYPDGNAWLGSPGYRTYSDPNEWPVCYHGTSLGAADKIISNHYIPGSGMAFGRGIYSTPDVKVAEDHGYVKTFVSQKDGRTYKVCLQNRINPWVRRVCDRPEYWLVPIPAGTPPATERDIVLSSIRPYSLLLKRA